MFVRSIFPANFKYFKVNRFGSIPDTTCGVLRGPSRLRLQYTGKLYSKRSLCFSMCTSKRYSWMPRRIYRMSTLTLNFAISGKFNQLKLFLLIVTSSYDVTICSIVRVGCKKKLGDKVKPVSKFICNNGIPLFEKRMDDNSHRT